MSWLKNRRKMWITILLLCAIALITGILCAVYIHRTVYAAGNGRIYTINQNIPHHKVALVLGARVFENGRLSAMLKDRVDAGIDLYRKGIVEKLLMSGDNRTRNYNEVTAMRNYAIAQGVPSDDIVRDFAGLRTYDSLYRAQKLWDLNEMIIVSQHFHLQRSLYIADKLGIDAIGVAAVDTKYRSLESASRREIGARILAWFDVLIGRDPYFLGPKETLSGDDQKTRIPE